MSVTDAPSAVRAHTCGTPGAMVSETRRADYRDDRGHAPMRATGVPVAGIGGFVGYEPGSRIVRRCRLITSHLPAVGAESFPARETGRRT
jgi:hypothetical protein